MVKVCRCEDVYLLHLTGLDWRLRKGGGHNHVHEQYIINYVLFHDTNRVSNYTQDNDDIHGDSDGDDG